MYYFRRFFAFLFFAEFFNGKDIVKNICYNSFIMATRIQVRRDTAANWTANDPTLSDGEIGFETDTGKFKIGKSNTSWISLQYAQVAGDDGLSYDIYPTVDSQGNLPPINSGITMNNTSIGASYYIFGADTLFKAGDWIKAVYVDRGGSIGTANTIYPDVFVEGYIWDITKYPEYNYNEYRFTATRINGGSQEGNTLGEWTTGLLPEPKATYEFPPFIYPVGDSLAGVRTAPPAKPASVGEEYVIEGQPGLYQVGQKIRMQSLDEFGVAIPEDYAILEVLGIQKYIEGTQTDGLEVKCLEVYVDINSIPYFLSFSLHASDGPQGPGYEVTYDSNVHMLYDDVSYVWNAYSVTSWAEGMQYTVPGDFSNSSYRVGDYVKFHFEDPSLPASPYIEGWIYQLDPTFARIVVQRWSNNSDWSTTVASAAAIVPIFSAHFEPGYNFDRRISVSDGMVQAPFTNISYSTFLSDIQYGTSRSFEGYHRGSYNPGDYVVISSRSNPGIKVFAYIGSIGYANFADQFYIYPLEVLTWDASEEDTFNDWTLSIASPPKKEYKLTNPLPLPWDAVDIPPAPLSPTTAFAKPAILDVVSIVGDPGLFEVGNLVRAVSKSEPTAAFYGEITEIGSASNSFVNSIEVSDVSEWTVAAENTYNDWQLSLGQKPVEYQLATPETITPVFDSGNSYTYSLSEEDAGRTILGNQGGQAYIIVDGGMQVPVGTQITVLSIAGNPLTIGPAYFTETDTITSGYVTIDQYAAATLVRTGFGWVIVGKFSSAVASIGGGGG